MKPLKGLIKVQQNKRSKPKRLAFSHHLAVYRVYIYRVYTGCIQGVYFVNNNLKVIKRKIKIKAKT